MEHERALSVSEAIHTAHMAVGSIPAFTVVGEVSGFRGPNSRSGHCYFQIKDASATMDVIVWRGIYAASGIRLEDGITVQMTGAFDIYEASGKLSFKAKTLSVAGEGLLRQQVAALAKKLEAEGLMDSTRKRKIPAFCTRVAVVTSLSGSVIEDVRRTLLRRNPLVELLCAGCSVQGATAAPTIIHALQVAAAAQPDCIMLVRGGGSYEDLMCFNDEALARTVAACPVPVVTGIGHEPDVTICDMVSDRRTSTPTAAAESVAPSLSEIVAAVNTRQDRLSQVMAAMVTAAKISVDACANRTTLAMQSRLSIEKTHLDALAKHRCLTDPSSLVDDRVSALIQTEQRLMDALPRIVERRLHDVSVLGTRLTSAGARMTRPYELALDRQAASLQALSPLNVLSRGYSIVRTSAGAVVSEANQVSTHDQLTVMLRNGQLDVTVNTVQSNPSTE